MTRIFYILTLVLVTGCWTNPAVSDMYSQDGTDESQFNESLLLAALGISASGSTGNSGSTSTSSILKYAYFGASSNVAMFAVDDATGALSALSPATISAGNATWNVVADPQGRFLYAPSRSDDTISMYTIDASTGQLTALGTPIIATVGSGPRAFAVDPTGNYAYAGFFNSGGISQFIINQTTGELTYNATNTTTGCNNASDLEFHPTNGYLYAACSNSQLKVYTVQADGTLSQISNRGFSYGQPKISFSGTGDFLYLTSFSGSSAVSMFSIDSVTGAASSPTTIATGQFPADVAAAAAGSGQVYAACYGDNRIRQYTADSTTGILTANGIFNGSSSSIMTIMADTKGRYLYMTSSGNNTVRQLTIDATTGTLSITNSYSGLSGVRGLWLVYSQ